MIKIKVPATSANMGPGFDCMGVALNLYNEVCIEEINSDGVEIVVLDDSKKFMPTDERNYIYVAMDRAFKKVGKKLSGYRITIDNKVPVTRGLGSSSAGIVSGLAGANYILGNALTTDELLEIACDIEGHPDNVAPALLGGYVVALKCNDKVHYIKTDVTDDIAFVAMIPQFPFKTKKSRSILPRYVSHKNAVFNVCHASLLSAAFTKGDLTFIGDCIDDRLHQGYRLPHIKNGEYVMKLLKEAGADACYLSGAGPTIMAIVKGDGKAFAEKLDITSDNKLCDWDVKVLKADNVGVQVFEE